VERVVPVLRRVLCSRDIVAYVGRSILSLRQLLTLHSLGVVQLDETS